MAQAAARERRLDHAARRAVRLAGRRRADARIGLSSAHISPRSWADYTPDGSYLALHEGRQRKCPVAPTTRGAIHGFSRQSRGRLLRTLAKVDRQASSTALFVTLTYPLSAEVDFAGSKRHLDSFAKRLRRKFVRCAVIWRLELQRNGTPHFHLIVFGQRFIPHEWVARAWAEVCDTGNPDHERAGTETRRVSSFKEAFSYAAKYAAKLPEGEVAETEGRVWGVIGRRWLPIRLLQWELDGRGEARLARALRNLVDSRSKRAVPREFYPKWIIIDGRRAERMIAWAAELPTF